MRRTKTAAVLAAVLVASGIAVPEVAAAPAAAQGTAGAPPGAEVTLLTGDRVRLGGPRGAVVTPAAGREKVVFSVRTDRNGHVHVLPADAGAGVAGGRLDPALFDVTGLVEARYDDASRADLPLIVDFPGATPRAMTGARVERELPVLGAAAVRTDRTPASWAGLRRAEHVWLDAPVRMSLDRSVPQIRAPQAWAAGHTGAGTTVAVLDTGIDTTHPDLAGAVVAARDFTDGQTGTDDLAGHGTHVASIITGAGERYVGVAPDTKLLNGKVLDNRGSGALSSIIAGMEWAVANGADVINLSLGGGADSDGADPLSLAVDKVSEETGVLVVAAAGNDGRRATWTVGSPAAAAEALTVGAVDRADVPADFSTPGPRAGDGGIKPDLTAPGVGIVAAKARNGVIGEPVDDGHVAMDGTSMAAPHVAGAAAILAGVHPDWTGRQLKAALMNTAVPAPGVSVFKQGAGRVDVAAAAEATVTASPGSLSLGRAQWPHADDQPMTKSVTYDNPGKTPLTLRLSVAVPDAPEGMFTVEPATVTVPAGGQATARVTADTRVDAPDGRYPGLLTATGAGHTLRTPLSAEREVESYDLTMTFLDDAGVPTADTWVTLVDVHGPWGRHVWDPSGTVRMRLPKGEYFLGGSLYFGDSFTSIAEPAIVVDRDTTMTFDARERARIGFTVDEPDARLGVGTVDLIRQTDDGPEGQSVQSWDATDLTVLPSVTASPEFRFGVEGRLARPDGDDVAPAFEASPYLYDLVWADENGRVPANVHRTFRNADLAQVAGSYGRSAPGGFGVRDEMVGGLLPFTIKEFYTPGTPVQPRFYEVAARGGYRYVTFAETVIPREYQRGRVTEERYNTGVFGPAFAFHDDYPNFMMSGRYENHLGVNLPWATDQGRGRVNPMAAGFGATGSMELLRGGEVIGEWPYPSGGDWEVGPEESTYTIRASADRSAIASVSTKLSGEWTFRSAHVPGIVPEPLPLMAVRFAPKLDLNNSAPAGKGFRIPVYVQRGGSPTPIALPAPPAVDVSYDDGATWKKARVTSAGQDWILDVDHPAGAAFVSLRASVADGEGNSAKNTVIRAYALR